MNSPILLDSDILINVLRQRPPVFTHAQQYLILFRELQVSAVTFYEVRRGLQVAQAAVQQRRLKLLDTRLRILPVARTVAAKAADLYVYLRNQNALLPDADILIAATALTHNLTLATSNQRHYSRIPDLTLVDWRQTTST